MGIDFGMSSMSEYWAKSRNRDRLVTPALARMVCSDGGVEKMECGQNVQNERWVMDV